MSEIETFDELEAGLRRAFHRGPLPVAPDRLRAGLVGVVAAEAPVRGAGTSQSRRGPWGLLGLAAVLAVGGVLAVVGGGGFGPTPSRPAVIGPSGISTTRITYAIAWTAEAPADDVARAGIVRVLSDRLTALGLRTATVTPVDVDRIAVDVPTDSDIDRVRRVLGAPGRVTFVPLGTDQANRGDRIDPALPALFGGDQIESASVSTDQTGLRVVDFVLAPGGSQLFADWTRTHVGSMFAIVIDGTILTAPIVNSEIQGGNVEITSPGGFDAPDAQETVALLGSGELPVAIRELSVDPNGPILPPGSAQPATAPVGSPAASGAAATPSLPSGSDVDCPAPVVASGPVMTCQAAVATALALLPPGLAPVGPIEFVHTCVDVTGRGAQLDCFIDGFGLVTMHLSNGERLVVQTSVGHAGAQVVAPLGGDDANQVELPLGVRCQGDIEAAIYTLRIDPTASPAVWLETPAGNRVEVRFATPVVGVARPFPMLLAAPDHVASGRWFLAGDGARIPTGGDPSVGPPRLFACGAADGALILEAGGN
jgi:hypothetical protein